MANSSQDECSERAQDCFADLFPHWEDSLNVTIACVQYSDGFPAHANAEILCHQVSNRVPMLIENIDKNGTWSLGSIRLCQRQTGNTCKENCPEGTTCEPLHSPCLRRGSSLG